MYNLHLRVFLIVRLIEFDKCVCLNFDIATMVGTKPAIALPQS